MAKFKLVISDPKAGTSKSITIEGTQAQNLVGQKIGDIIDGSIIGIKDVSLVVTGGSDRDGFSMRSDVHGGTKIPVLLTDGVGFNSKRKGERRRKSVRGNTITEFITQINMKISDKSEKSV